MLMDEGAEFSAAGKNGSTPLHNAARHGHEAVARLLTDGGADVLAADKDGLTPLHEAT